MTGIREKLIEVLNDAHLPMMHGEVQIGEYCIPYSFAKRIADHLIANDVTFADDKNALNRLGAFGKLFVDYKGCPRGMFGPRGTAGGEEQPDHIQALVEGVHLMDTIKDVDKNVWRPVLESDLNLLIDQLQQLHESSRWIPVTERLPEPGMIVLAYLDKPHQRLNAPYEESVLLLQYEKIERIDGVIWEWKRPFGGETVSYNPTHWMPIPEPPKGE